MLIDFRVKNFRSIRNEQTLSMIAAKDSSHCKTHLTKTGVTSLPHLLKSAVIYGANASGKTNMIRALEFMVGVVSESANLQLQQTYNLQPFKLDKTTINKPSEFEITFLDNGIRFQYGFSMTSSQIIEEWLLVYNKSKPQEWFSRTYNKKTNKDEYQFGTHFKGQKKLWQESTRPNGLFLSTAVKLNSEQLKPIYTYIVGKMHVFVSGAHPVTDYSLEMLKSDTGKRNITNFLSSADIGITSIGTVSKKQAMNHFRIKLDNSNGQLLSSTQHRGNVEKEIIIPKFKHETKAGSAEFDLEDESQGTQKLFCLAAPILEILEAGDIMVVDELDTSLHPLLVKRLVNLFNSDKNKNGAQLIFTTHDTSLLDSELFRRDQIWFVEKDRDQITNLYPLTEFSPRKNEALERGYLTGRYGALPFFRDFEAE